MEKWHGADVEDEVVNATTSGKEEVRCRYRRRGAQVGISRFLGKWRLQRMRSAGMEQQGMLGNYLLETGDGGRRIACLTNCSTFKVWGRLMNTSKLGTCWVAVCSCFCELWCKLVPEFRLQSLRNSSSSHLAPGCRCTLLLQASTPAGRLATSVTRKCCPSLRHCPCTLLQFTCLFELRCALACQSSLMPPQSSPSPSPLTRYPEQFTFVPGHSGCAQLWTPRELRRHVLSCGVHKQW
jgi:hypothetical protein